MQKYFVGGKQASEIIGVHQRTLYNWEEKGLIETMRTPGNKRLYNVSKYIEGDNKLERKKIAYVRVSSHSQVNDLERQIEEMKSLYPDHELIQDIGSGISLTKKGISKIIDLAIEGRIEEVVVLHKDRLCRFGFDLIEKLICDYSKGRITIVHEKEDSTPEEELVKDVMQILNVYTAKMNGLRRYAKLKDYQEI